MQTNPNIESKKIIEVWEWHDGWGKSCKTKKLYRKLRRKRNKGEIKSWKLKYVVQI